MLLTMKMEKSCFSQHQPALGSDLRDYYESNLCQLERNDGVRLQCESTVPIENELTLNQKDSNHLITLTVLSALNVPEIITSKHGYIKMEMVMPHSAGF
ncbi:hypothetical protein Tco_0078834 [Tanacetum coccineum]